MIKLVEMFDRRWRVVEGSAGGAGGAEDRKKKKGTNVLSFNKTDRPVLKVFTVKFRSRGERVYTEDRVR